MSGDGYGLGGGSAPGAAVINETAFGQAPAVGASLDYARADHTHGTPNAPAAPELGWITAYDVDFSTFLSQNLAPDGAYALGGPVWNSLNSANAALMRVQNGTGLQIDTSLAASQYFALRSSPMIYIPVTTFFGGYDANLHKLRLSIHVVTQTQAYNNGTAGVKAGVECSTTPLNQAYAIIRGRNGGVSAATQSKSYTGPNTVTAAFIPSGARDVFVVEYDDQIAQGYWGTYAAGWPTTLLAPMYVTMVGWPGAGFVPDNRVYRAGGGMNIFLANDTGGVGGAGVNFSTTITHFRVQYQTR